MIAEEYEDGKTVTSAYDNCGNLATVTDSETGIVTTYYYDLLNRQSGYRKKGTNLDHSVKYEYDDKNNLASMTEVINGVSKVYSYTYDEDNRLISESIGEPVVSEPPENNINITYSYDGFGRLETRTVKQGETTIQSSTPTYATGNAENTTSGQVTSYNGYTYTYDNNGNILTISDGTYTTSYEYDSANQLIRENNQELGFTYTWKYDNAGNIMERKVYAYTTGRLGAVTDTVVYDYFSSVWGDMLTAYDGNTISYDGMGNPTSDGTWSYTWQHGKELVSMSDGTTTWTFTYDANGMRTERSPGDEQGTYTYVYNGNKLIEMTVQGVTLRFAYDASGNPLTVTVGNSAVYYYKTNLQGDVIGILNSTGVQVVTYAYDAWGNVQILQQSDQIAEFNPLLYRGYVYDWETDLYYLQSRYYNPEWGRFINADILISTGQGFVGNNMFAYCGNNPVMFSDPCGTCIHRWYFLGLVDCDTCKAKKNANKVKYDVPLYDQGQYNLCWAYCQVMIDDWYNGNESKETEAFQKAKNYAVEKHGESDWNYGAFPSNTGFKRNINNIEDLFYLVRGHGPVYAYYNNGKTGDDAKAHLVVVTGVDLNKDIVYTNNPWGVRGKQTFEEFQAGFATKWYHSKPGMNFVCVYLVEY